jgi:uncharacterized protein (TIGR02001 family)
LSCFLRNRVPECARPTKGNACGFSLHSLFYHQRGQSRTVTFAVCRTRDLGMGVKTIMQFKGTLQIIAATGALAFAALASLPMTTSPARAGDAPAFAYTFNIGVVSDYRFRGISQKKEEPAIQGGVDFSYGIGYFGLWGSNIDFGDDSLGRGIAPVEIDIYGGIKPVWGPVTFDLGLLYYAYPGARDTFAGGLAGSNEIDYFEGKIGASMNPVTNLTTGVTVYYSPDYTLETGSVVSVEGTAAYVLPKIWIFDPSISGRIGFQHGDDIAYKNLTSNGSSSYLYWDAGLTLTVEKLALDFRYVDTDIANNNAAGGFADNFCNGTVLQCGSAFVFSAKITLP